MKYTNMAMWRRIRKRLKERVTKKNETKLLQERKGERKLQSGVGITGENFITSLRLGEVDEGREGGGE